MITHGWLRRARDWVWLATVNLLVIAVFGLLALAGLEGYLRWNIPKSSEGSIFEPTLATKRYKVMKRNASIVAWGSEFRTNDLGFRAASKNAPAAIPHGFRVAVLGDSFTASAGVDFDKIYTSRLEQGLRTRFPDAEVINLSVGGYNIVQYELVLREVALSLHPKLIVVSVFPFNDLSNDTYRANFDVASGRAQSANPQKWYEGFYVYRAYISRVVGRLSSIVWPPAPVNSEAKTRSREIAERDKRENLAALEAIVDVAHTNGIDILVVLLPNTDNFADQQGDFAPFDELCRLHRWDCVNLLDSFASSGVRPKTLQLNILDGHPNEQYNAMVAAYLMPFVAGRIERARSTTNIDQEGKR